MARRRPEGLTPVIGEHVRQIGVAALFSFAAAAVASVTWGGLLVANAKTSPSVPWSVGVMAVVLVGYWSYLSGRGWPRRTRSERAVLLRARLVAPRVFGSAVLAGGLALVALAGLWVVLVQLTGNGGNPTESSPNTYPTIFVALAIAMGSLVSPLSEEASFRGYAQVILERHYPALVAVAISSLFFAAWHGPTQGFLWSKLLFFFAVGVVFGTIAYLTNSTLPAIPVHIAGDLYFFLVIWPQDVHRHLVLRYGTDSSFWICLAQMIVFTALAGVAFWQLARLGRAPLQRMITNGSDP